MCCQIVDRRYTAPSSRRFQRRPAPPQACLLSLRQLHILFEELKLSKYLHDNRNQSLSKIIFSVRSKTLDLKTLQPWKYFDNLCVLCEKKAETILHFMTCNSYKNIAPESDWELIYENNTDKQFEIAENISKRLKQRRTKIDNYEAGHPQELAYSKAPGHC